MWHNLPIITAFTGTKHFILPRHAVPVTRPGNEHSRAFRLRKVCSMKPRNGIA